MSGIEKVLNKMCSFAGVKKCNFKKEGWYLKNSWTLEQQNDFIDWFTKELLEDKDLRNIVMQFPVKDKNKCKKVAESFTWNYGWKLK